MGIALLVGCSDDCPTCNVPDKPTAPCDPSPATGASGVPDGIVLSWDCGECECGLKVTYDIHFGADTEPPLVSSDFEQKRYGPGSLEPGTHYYWKIVARSSVGSTPGELWDFQTAAEDTCTDMPTAPCNPSPADGTSDVPLDGVLLTWECGESQCGLPVTYDIYFGEASVGDQLVCSDCTTRTYDPGTLSRSRIYVWWVVAKDSNGEAFTGLWAFMTTAGDLRSWYIKADGTGDVPTIQAGVDIAASGDTLLLADGTYRGEGNRGVGIGEGRLVIKSESGNPEACVIDCEHSGSGGLRFAGWESGVTGKVEGIKIIGATTAVRSSMEACVQVVNCVISDCTEYAVIATGQPAQAYAWLGLSFCEVSSNPAGAMYCGYKCHISATKCVFRDNEFALLLGERAECGFDRCTIIGNNGGPDGVIRGIGGCVSFVDLRQSILAFNTGIPVRQYSCDLRVKCCDVFGNTEGDYVGCLAGKQGIDGNFSLDPGFCDYSGGDLRPRLDSPCAEGNHPDGSDCGRIGAFSAGCD